MTEKSLEYKAWRAIGIMVLGIGVAIGLVMGGMALERRWAASPSSPVSHDRAEAACISQGGTYAPYSGCIR